MFFHKAADDLTGANQGFFLFLIQRKLPHLFCSVPAYDAQSTGKDTLLAILTGEKGRAGHHPLFIPQDGPGDGGSGRGHTKLGGTFAQHDLPADPP